jgi:hypothetical protein
MMMTGSFGKRAEMFSRRLKPSISGMRISETTTSGCSIASCAMASAPFSNTATVMPAWVNALSRTQRIDRSSSMTHTRVPLMSCSPRAG